MTTPQGTGKDDKKKVHTVLHAEQKTKTFSGTRRHVISHDTLIVMASFVCLLQSLSEILDIAG